MPDENNNPNIHAENNSIAVGGISAGGNIGDININTGYTPEQVSVLITQITSTLQPKAFDGRCPYKGLDVFEEEDAELFFGRKKLVDDLISRVKDSRTVFVTGPSGSGKSSLVRAGLIHALKQGAIKGSERWLYATMKPGRDPLESLANAFSRLKSPELGNYIRQHVDQVKVLHECAESALTDSKNQRLVLFIDQFEEVFTQINNETERVAFLNQLTHAATIENGRVIILFSMRSDFVSNCATYPQLNALLNQQFVQIGGMQPEELVSAIAQPALRVGLQIDPDLIAQIINEMKGEPGALPLMQFALKDLFDSQGEKSGVIALTLNGYLQRGGIHKALERHADDSFSKLNRNEQELARSIFSGLIEIGRGTQDTRRTALFDELVPSNTKTKDVEAIVHKLADARLITTDEQAGKDTVTISHEKLIDAWPWLKKLVNENREVIALQNDIAEDAKEWNDHKRDNSYLYSGARLATAQEKIKDLVLSENAQYFLETSSNVTQSALLRSNRVRITIYAGLIGFSTIILGLLIFALIQLNIARAQRLGSQAQAAFAEKKYNEALLYAYQSNQIHKNDAAELVLGQIAYKNFSGGKQLIGTSKVDWGGVLSLAWSPNGRLASGSYEGIVTIWDLQTDQSTHIVIGSRSVDDLAWSADGRLAASSYDRVAIWDFKKEQLVQTLRVKVPESYVESTAWSEDGQLASGLSDGTVIIWDLKTGQLAQTLRGHAGEVASVAWSPSGQLASGSRDGNVIIWDPHTGQPVQTLMGHMDGVSSVAWSPSGQLASGSLDGTLIIWNLETGKPLQILKGHTSIVRSVAWSPGGQLASGSNDGTVIIWNLQTGLTSQILEGQTAIVLSVAWSPNGQLASGTMDGTAVIWDLRTSQPAQTFEGHTKSVSSAAWSADGKLASGSGDGTVIIWDIQTGQAAQILKGHTDIIRSVAWSSSGQLASGSNDDTVIIWNLQTGQPAQILRGHTGWVNSVAWSPNGQLASGSEDGTVIIWDLQTGQPAQILKENKSSISSVAWSHDGQLASGLENREGNGFSSSVIIWDLQTGRPARTLKGHNSFVESVAWSGDGQLASGSIDRTVIIWNLKTGLPAQILYGHTGTIASVAWSPDGRLASGSWDDTAIIWDIQTGRPVQTLRGHTSAVYSVAWSVHGQLASGSGDKTIKIPSQILITNPCAKILRNMTVQEWLDYQGLLYTYQPACPDLYDPTAELGPLSLFTWKGRAIIIVITLSTPIVLTLFLWIFYKSITWAVRKAQVKGRS